MKWGATKRFGLDGAETFIPCMKYIIDECADMGVDDFAIGMPQCHRERYGTYR